MEGSRVPPKVVGDVINGRKLITISPSASLGSAMALMTQANVHRLPVVVDGNTLVGILSMSDLRVAVDSPLHGVQSDTARKHFEETSVEKAMRRQVETVEPDESLLDVAKLLRVSSLNALVVVEKGTTNKALGVISRTDILDDYIRHLEPLT